MKAKKKAPKGETINVRCTAQQKEMLEKVAAHEGLGVSTWLLHAGLLLADERKGRR